MGKKSQELKVGYWGKAKVKKGEAGSLKLTQPVGQLNPLGPERISMDEKSILRQWTRTGTVGLTMLK